MTDVLDGAPAIIARPARDLAELGHEPLTAAGLTINTLRRVAAGESADGQKVIFRVRNEARDAITEWGRFKLTMPPNVVRGIERIESSKRPISGDEAVKLSEKAQHRLSLAEGLLLAFGSAGRKDPALVRIEESARKLIGESDNPRAALEAECAVDKFLVEALGYAKHPIKGEGGKFHGMHGVERAVKKRTLIPEKETPAVEGEPKVEAEPEPVVEASTKPTPDRRRAGIANASGPSLGDRLAGQASDPRFDELHPRAQGGRFGTKGDMSPAKGPHAAAGSTAAGAKGQIASPEQIAALLEALGWDPSNLAGYQKQVGLKATGKIDPVTYEMLREMAAKRAATPGKGEVVLSADQTSTQSGGTHGPQTPKGRGKAAKKKAVVKEATVVGGVATAAGGPNPSALTVAKVVQLEHGGDVRRRRDSFETDVRVTELIGLRSRLADVVEARKAAPDVAAFTRARAREQGIRERIKEVEATMDGKLREDTDSRSLPDLPDKPGKSNWVEKAGGLPSYIKRIAKHLHSEKGMDVSRAIATAVNVVKKMCASGDLNFHGKQSVNAGSRAEACKAVAEWERKKGGAHLKEAAEFVEKAGEIPGFAYPTVGECYEIVEAMERAEQTAALRERLAEAVARRKAAANSREFSIARAHEEALRSELREAEAA